MSKIQLTLTEEHYDKRVAHEEGWIDEDDPEVTLRLYYLFHPLTLEFDVPSPWSTDIENAPRDGTYIIAIDDENCASRVAWRGEHCPKCHWEGEFNSLKDSEIFCYMICPELPTI